jgi:hypothetical protein
MTPVLLVQAFLARGGGRADLECWRRAWQHGARRRPGMQWEMKPEDQWAVRWRPGDRRLRTQSSIRKLRSCSLRLG